MDALLNDSSLEIERQLDLLWWQDELLNDLESDVLAVSAGYGSGKTLAAALWTIDRLAYNAGCDALFIEPRLTDFEKIAFPAFECAFELLGMLPGIDYKIYKDKSNPRVEFPGSKQTVYCLTGEKPENIVGITTAAIAVIDEAGLMVEDVFKKTRSRLRYHKALKTQILCTGTPEGLNWFSDTFDSDALPGWRPGPANNGKDYITAKRIEEDNGTISHRLYRRFRATVYGNRHNLSASYIPDLLETWKFNQNYIDSYIYGYFRPFATGLAYANFKSTKHKIKPIGLDPRKPIHLTWDFNIEPTWVSMQRQRDGRPGYKPKFWAALHNSDSGAQFLQDSVCEFVFKHPRERFKNTPIILYGDSSGHSRHHRTRLNDYHQIKKDLNKLGYTDVRIMAIKSNPRERQSVDLVNSEFTDDNFRITENCGRVLKSVTRTTWKNDRRENLDKPAGETHTHHMDAVKYFFCALHDMSGRQVLGGRL